MLYNHRTKPNHGRSSLLHKRLSDEIPSCEMLKVNFQPHQWDAAPAGTCPHVVNSPRLSFVRSETSAVSLPGCCPVWRQARPALQSRASHQTGCQSVSAAQSVLNCCYIASMFQSDTGALGLASLFCSSLSFRRSQKVSFWLDVLILAGWTYLWTDGRMRIRTVFIAK